MTRIPPVTALRNPEAAVGTREEAMGTQYTVHFLKEKWGRLGLKHHMT